VAVHEGSADVRQNWLEWAILVVSLGAVALLVGYLAFVGVSGSGPAMIRAEAQADGMAAGPDGGWLVPVTVRNEGGTAAVAIVVEGTATVDGSEETSEITLDVLAAESQVDIVLGFSDQPEGDVELRIVGFEEP
jgi:uncharacterized protein (TIGR02588 family)